MSIFFTGSGITVFNVSENNELAAGGHRDVQKGEEDRSDQYEFLARSVKQVDSSSRSSFI